jgi:hypothetical protein
MAITTVQGNSKKFKAILIKKHVIGPGGVVLEKGKRVRVSEADAYTLVSGEQAEFIKDEAPAADTK